MTLDTNTTNGININTIQNQIKKLYSLHDCTATKISQMRIKKKICDLEKILSKHKNGLSN